MNTEINTNYQFRVLKAKGKEKYYPQIKYPGSVEWSFDPHPEYKTIIVRDTYEDAVKNWTMDLRYRSYIHSNEDVPLVREDPNEKVLVGKWEQIHENVFKNFEKTKEHLVQRLNKTYAIIKPLDDPKFEIFNWEVFNCDSVRCIHLYLFNNDYVNPKFVDFYFPFEILNYAVEKDVKEEYDKFLKKYPNTFGAAKLVDK